VNERVSRFWRSTDLMRKRAVTIIAAGAAGWLILLLMCAYSKARERRN